MSMVDIPHLIGTWPPPGDRLHNSELRNRWPHPDNMRRTFCNWALIYEGSDPLGVLVRVWYYTYLRFLRA